MGASAMGGVIALRTQTLAKPVKEVYGEAGSFSTFGLRGGKSLGEGSLRGLVGFDLTATEGNFTYLNDQGTLFDGSEGDDETVVRENNHSRQGSGILKIGWKPSKSIELKLLELFSVQESGVPGQGVTQTSSTSYERMKTLTGLNFRFQPVQSSYQLELASYVSHSLSELSNPLGEVALARGDFEDEVLTTGGKLRAGWGFDDILGDASALMPELNLQARYERFTPDETMVRVTPSRRVFANAGAGVTSHWDRLRLELMTSVGYEYSESRIDAPEYLLASTAGDVPEDAPHHALTWHVGAAWSPFDSLSLSANAARAVRMPNLFELFGNSGTVRGNPALVPEEGLNVDLGMETEQYFQPGRTRLSIGLVGFLRLTEGLIQFSQNAQNVAVARNIESAQLRGQELSVKLQTLNCWRLAMAFTHLQTINKTDIAARRGKRLPRRPALQAYVRSELYGHPSWADEVAWAIDTEHTQGNFLDDANLVAVPARWLLGTSVRAGLDSDWDVSVQLRNMLNSRVQDLSGFPLPGRSFMMTVRYQMSHAAERGH